MLVTAIAVVGVLPYIALQLKAVSFGFDLPMGASADGSHLVDSALTIAMMLAAFAILFGTRDLVSTENHHGMVLAIAFESLVKLAAFLAVGLYAVYGLRNGIADAYGHALALPQVASRTSEPLWRMGFVSQTLLAAIAIICLPRQFHVAVVENTVLSDLRTSRWVFPAYLAIISVFVLPIAASGLERFAGLSVPADTFVLALPLAGNHAVLALGAYLGGFSAATGMVIVETIALSNSRTSCRCSARRNGGRPARHRAARNGDGANRFAPCGCRGRCALADFLLLGVHAAVIHPASNLREFFIHNPRAHSRTFHQPSSRDSI